MSVPTQARSAQTKQFSSKIQGLLLNADSMFRDSEKGTLDLVGHVQLVFNGQHIQCEEAHLDLQKKMLEAKGNVLYTTTLSTIGAEKISINYETNLGIIHHG
jgi:LPS-assembly protein